MCCVSPLALLSALLLRAEREGYAITQQDWANVLGAGCKRAQIDAALDARHGAWVEQARKSLSTLPSAPG